MKFDEQSFQILSEQNRGVLPSIESFYNLDLASLESVDRLNFGSIDRETFLPQLRTLQRLLRITENNRSDAIAIFDAELYFAFQIAALKQALFINRAVGKGLAETPLNQERAIRIYQRAVQRSAFLSLLYMD